MLGSIVVAVNAATAFAGSSVPFVVSYVLLRLLLIALYLQAYAAVPEARAVSARYAGGFGLAVAVWLASLLVPEPGRYSVWAAALLVELGTWIVANVTAAEVPAQVSHMPERFGLFVLIVLGEAVLVATTGMAGTSWQPVSVAIGITGFGVALCLWWLYFDHLDVSVIDEALAGGTVDRARSHIWGNGHLFVSAAILAISVGIELAIEEASHATLTQGAGAAMAGGVAVYLVALSAVQWATPQSLPRTVLYARAAGAVGAAALATLAPVLPPLAGAVLVTAILAAVTASESLRRRGAPR
jgi:low temperature requirement protein LtrA